MEASLSNLTEGTNGSGHEPGLGDIPESCVACMFTYLTPPEICNLPSLNMAFRGAASSDSAWKSKLPLNYHDLLNLIPKPFEEGYLCYTGTGLYRHAHVPQISEYCEAQTALKLQNPSKPCNPIIELWWFFAISACVKLLLIPAYKSTDFKVLRRDEHLDPRLPAILYLLRAIPFRFRNLIDPQIIHLQKGLNYSSNTVLYFQRISVILSDLCLLYRNSNSMKQKMIWVLVIWSPMLVIVDHLHFQYNGFLLGILLISLSCLEEGWAYFCCAIVLQAFVCGRGACLLLLVEALLLESLEEGFLAKILVLEGSKDMPVGQPIAITVEDADDIQNLPANVVSGSEVKENIPAPQNVKNEKGVQDTSYVGINTSELPSHIVVEMPALSPTMSQGNIFKWRKKEGDKIEVGDIICEIETDKATIEYEFLEEGCRQAHIG
ncbi:hypothetical protein DVH24_041426 [Malus domestica]|uniref:Lipoyl-binding domain-containing protein n=1 Tax=Malus domestica TaxID=3750 RepID=A0A498IBE5_MALDO|nr:hypothetical protein DVH24_041426 [Malus domestica]